MLVNWMEAHLWHPSPAPFPTLAPPPARHQLCPAGARPRGGQVMEEDAEEQ